MTCQLHSPILLFSYCRNKAVILSWTGGTSPPLPLWQEEEGEEEEEEGVLLFVAIKYKNKNKGRATEKKSFPELAMEDEIEYEEDSEVNNNSEDCLGDSGIGDEGQADAEKEQDNFTKTTETEKKGGFDKHDEYDNEETKFSSPSKAEETKEDEIKFEMLNLEQKRTEDVKDVIETVTGTVFETDPEGPNSDEPLREAVSRTDFESVTLPLAEFAIDDKLSSIKEEGIKRVTWNETLEEKFGGHKSRSRGRNERGRRGEGRRRDQVKNQRLEVKEVGEGAGARSQSVLPERISLEEENKSRGARISSLHLPLVDRVAAWERSLRRPVRERPGRGERGEEGREGREGELRMGKRQEEIRDGEWEDEWDGEEAHSKSTVRRLRAKPHRPSSGRPIWNNAGTGKSFNR